MNNYTCTIHVALIHYEMSSSCVLVTTITTLGRAAAHVYVCTYVSKRRQPYKMAACRLAYFYSRIGLGAPCSEALALLKPTIYYASIADQRQTLFYVGTHMMHLLRGHAYHIDAGTCHVNTLKHEPNEVS